MTAKRLGEKFFLRFDYQENFLESLKNFCTSENIYLANLDGIGSFANSELAFYNVGTKKFQTKVVTNIHEVVSLDGSITEKDGQPYLHIHVVLSDENFAVVGGHLNQAMVGGTLEIVLEKVSGSLGRKFSEEIGLNLLDL